MSDQKPNTPVLEDESRKPSSSSNIVELRELSSQGSSTDRGRPTSRSANPDETTTTTKTTDLAVRDGAAAAARQLKQHPDGRFELTEEAGYERLGYCWPTWKKWTVLTSIFVVQLSMNFNAAVYANSSGMTAEFGITTPTFKLGQMIFLVAYAFGCELWAPFSEELGRWWVLQISLGLVNLWQIPSALAPNYWVLFVFRFLGGLSSAGGSVTLGMVADLWEPAYQQYAVAYVVFSSVTGSVIAPIFGGFIQEYLSWPWVYWICLMFGGVAQLFHAFTPETRATCILDKEAKRLRKLDPACNIYGPNEIRGNFWSRLSWKEVGVLMWRPYRFLIFEPIVTFLSLFSGFGDALIFLGLDSFGMVMKQWGFQTVAIGLSFIALLIGYLIAYGLFLPRYYFDRKKMNGDETKIDPERRLWLLLFLAPLLPIGLFCFGATSFGPAYGIHWIAPLICLCAIGVANFAIYMATIDYMVAAYGPYSASATGGNGFCRDFLAGISALYVRPFYTNIQPGTKFQLATPTFILGGIGCLVAIPVYIFYKWGFWFRHRSPFAQTLAREREVKKPERQEAMTRSSTPTTTPVQSRANSPSRAEVTAAMMTVV
ncbi:hypothetical protein D0867_12206 [Hortaea werneckii]|uniref:Major facilitator superfamily (MFS) profile domain-containing protein n=2 Tax=Hortaea werneckii TaxID=91943 RepID=A0A3M6Y8L1_HORWE|nr:MFS transporter [Hortaea werneckii]RMX99136.1 hypothetical protein D0867_12206 [Hortaea werneckii]